MEYENKTNKELTKFETVEMNFDGIQDFGRIITLDKKQKHVKKIMNLMNWN